MEMCLKIEIVWKIHINLGKKKKLTQMIRNIFKIIKFEKLKYLKNSPNSNIKLRSNICNALTN